jgi:hypothetical protein
VQTTNYSGENVSDPRQSTPISRAPSNPLEEFVVYARVERGTPDFQTAPADAQNDVDLILQSVVGVANRLAAKRRELEKSGKYTAAGIDDAIKNDPLRGEAITQLGGFLARTKRQWDAVSDAEEQIASGARVQLPDGTWQQRTPVRDAKTLTVGESIRFMEIRNALRRDPARADEIALEAFDRNDFEVLEAVEGCPKSLPCISAMAHKMLRDRRLAVYAQEKAVRQKVTELRQRVADKAAAALGVKLDS